MYLLFERFKRDFEKSTPIVLLFSLSIFLDAGAHFTRSPRRSTMKRLKAKIDFRYDVHDMVE